MPGAETVITPALDLAAFASNAVVRRRAAVVEERRDSARTAELEIGTIAFNNAEVVSDQVAALREFLEDDYRYWVFDNSSDEAVRAEIRRTCHESDVSYFQLPANPMSRMNPSRSHGVAMNWAYSNALARSGSACFGFVDPDIYPTSRCSILAAMGDQRCYGRLIERGPRWYLWAGFCFFRNPMPALNFLPIGDRDTGGASWRRLYRSLDKSAMEFPPITPETPATPERVGDWVHLSNSSRWRDDHVGPRPAPAAS
jgi:glycosyltransferase involved in cell wall biosynthesis